MPPLPIKSTADVKVSGTFENVALADKFTHRLSYKESCALEKYDITYDIFKVYIFQFLLEG